MSRTKALLCRLRTLHTVKLLETQGSAGFQRLWGSSRVADSGVGSVLRGEVTASVGRNSNQDVGMALVPNSVRFMGIGSLKEGNRAGQHGAKYPQTKADGSPEKSESDARKQFLEKAKEASASQADEPFRDAVESGQSFGKRTTELEFGVKDGKNTDEAIRNASEELFKQSTINGDSGDGPIREEDKRKYPEHATLEGFSEVGAEREERGGSRGFSEGEKVGDLRGREGESVLEVGGQGAGESHEDEGSGSGETGRENMEKTRSEMRAGKARSPQAGVIVGNVASAGANALENEPGGDTPQSAMMREESTDETLDKQGSVTPT